MFRKGNCPPTSVDVLQGTILLNVDMLTIAKEQSIRWKSLRFIE